MGRDRWERGAMRIMRITSSDKTVLALIGLVIAVAGGFTYAQRQQPSTPAPEEPVVVEQPKEPEQQPEEDWSTPEALLKAKVYEAVSKDIVRSVGIEYDREYDAYSVVVALNDRMEDDDFDSHAPSTKLYYDLYKQKDFPIKRVAVSVYQERVNAYGTSEQIRMFETEMTRETVSNSINFTPAEPAVRDMIRQKWTVVFDQRVVDAKLAEKRAKQSVRSRFGEIKQGMTEEAVQEIMGQKGSCSKDSTLASQAKVCTYHEQAQVHYLNTSVTDKKFIRKRT